MQQCTLRKITPVNGFDASDRDNARQNNYAWSMAQFGDYLYVGTGRNIPYTTLTGLGIPLPPSLTPKNPENDAEIWRYPLRGCHRKWERVYRAPDGAGIMGFRYMIVYTGSDGVTALYCAAFGVFTENPLLMTTDGVSFVEVDSGLAEGFSTRTMISFRGRLYQGATNALEFSGESFLFVTDDPKSGWQQVNFGSGHIPTGEVVSMIEFNGKLYIGTTPAGGFEVWMSATPDAGNWQLVVDKGAGDALNEVPMSMEVFKGHLYVGSGIWAGLQSVDPSKLLVPPKGFDLIRIAKDGRWKVVVGSTPIAPTDPTTGTRNRARYPSGFGSIFNNYCWQLRAFSGRLYVGTWDSAVLVRSIINGLIGVDEGFVNDELTMENVLQVSRRLPFEFKLEYNWGEWLLSLIKSLPKYPREFGFDFIYSCDGESFCPISLDGLDNPRNYGLRTMVVSNEKDRMFIGTANPYQGCEVWRMLR